MKKALIGLQLLLIPLGSSLAQSPAKTDEPTPSIQQFPLEISFLKHAVSSPFDSEIFGILHPGFSVGTEYAYREGKHGRLFQNFSGGYYHNKYNAKAFFLQTSLGYRYTLELGWFGDLFLGMGYLRSYHPSEVFRLNEQGEYEGVGNRGKGAATLSFALGGGYDFSRKLDWPISAFVRYQPYVQTPYSVEESTLSQATLHFGARVQIW